MIRSAQNFVFRGLLINHDLEGLKNAGLLPDSGLRLGESSADDKSGQIMLDDFESSIRLNAIKMAGVYTAFFCFENHVRSLIKERLVDRAGSAWWLKLVSAKIRRKVEDRKLEEKRNKWHSPRAHSDNIAYTDFGDMADIICVNWDKFSDLFPDQDWVRSKLGDLELSRNTIAHNNVLSDRDMKRIKMYLEDWISQTG